MKETTKTVLYKFAGWLTADIPQLSGIEAPLLAESADRFIAVITAEDADCYCCGAPAGELHEFGCEESEL